MPDTKRYSVSFYAAHVINGTDNPPFLSSLLQDVDQSLLPLEHRVGDQVFQLRELDVMHGGRIRGVLAKFRANDLPNIGDRSSIDERPIDLEDSEGLIEKNYFLYDPGLELLTFQVNGNGMTVNKAAETIGSALCARSTVAVGLTPVLRPDAIERILSGEMKPRKFEIGFAKPTSPDAYVNHNEFSGPLMALLSSYEGVSCSVTVSANPPGRSNTRNYLSDTVKTGMALMVGSSMPVKLSKIWFDEDSDPIDLIEDRIKGYTDPVDQVGRYPDPQSIYSALEKVREKHIEDIRLVLHEQGIE